MSIGATTQWRIRAGGDEANGGGYDPAISGAGTDYTDQDAAQLSLTDLATSGAGSTTLTSVTGGFTSAMIGNCIRISSGTNFQAGYYFVTARTDTNTVTLDRTPTSGGAGSNGVGKLGGALAHLNNLNSGAGSIAAPAVTSPLAAGHTIYVRGSGSDNPGSADYTTTGYATFANGNDTSGRIRVIGYNGRPRFDSNGLYLYQNTAWHYENLMVKWTGASNGGLGWANGHAKFIDCRFDQNGNDVTAVGGGHLVRNCEFLNSGGTSSGTNHAVLSFGYGCLVIASTFTAWRGPAIKVASVATICFNTIRTNHSSGRAIDVVVNADFNYQHHIFNNTIYASDGTAIEITSGYGLYNVNIFNNVIKNNGTFGLKDTSKTQAFNDRCGSLTDYNVFHNNTSGDYSGISAGVHDHSIDPNFVNAAGGDFTPQEPTLEGTAFPLSLNSINNFGWPGAIQPEDQGGGGGAKSLFVGQGVSLV